MSDDAERIRRLETENDLLAFEVEALRSAGGDLEHGPDAARLAELEQAERDLRWLLRRLGSGPWGWLVRRRRGWRRLADRHLRR